MSLNTLSLEKHFSDVKNDPDRQNADVVCLQETWLHDSPNLSEVYPLETYSSQLTNWGRGKGIVTFYRHNFSAIKDVTTEHFQISMVKSPEFYVIHVYRSRNAGKKFIDNLINFIDLDKNVVICGDLNFCSIDKDTHRIYTTLKSLQFKQLVCEATHSEGRSLDHLYVYLKDNTLKAESKVNGCYYSDHDKVILYLDEI